MKLSLLFVIISMSSSSNLIHIISGLTRVPRIYAEFRQSLGLPLVVHMGCRGTVEFPSGTNSVAVSNLIVGNIGIQIPTIYGEPIMGVRQDVVHVPSSRVSGIIGIGPGSDLLRRVGGHIDFVRQGTAAGGFLRLGGTEQDFIANDCLPNSVMRMQAVVAHDSASPYNRRVEANISISIGENVFATDSMSFIDSEDFLLSIPFTWVAYINAEIAPT